MDDELHCSLDFTEGIPSRGTGCNRLLHPCGGLRLSLLQGLDRPGVLGVARGVGSEGDKYVVPLLSRGSAPSLGGTDDKFSDGKVIRASEFVLAEDLEVALYT
eukprot:gnl/TRDRNA2_/TRDRNA2_176165_c1_seq2.p2 gnl/TRDRNA2_/TRDRNA2_176165_c1~~gnl/TRDRNA2_/TRDRNA2_176165_c1_seq2.p2  ORF type:complete len:103 (+),score=13.65 gnl/TRDRNA2_/TRDRNA2_176165_c1_seq2:395-703(+)